MPGERGFVGGTVDASTGLVHLGARDYDADLGRFVSLDPVLDPSSPQQINGYNYANSNPVVLSDPTGLAPEDSPGYCVGRYGDCGIDPAVGGDIRGHYSDEQLSQKGVKRGQAASEEKRRQRNRAQATGAKRESPSFLEWLDAALPPFSGLGAVYHLIRAESPSEAVHRGLDIIGYVPIIGEAADIANAGLYAGDGDDFNAALSAGAAIPFLGWAAAGAKAGKQGLKQAAATAPGVAKELQDGKSLFHYTDEAGQAGIRESGELRPSLKAANPTDAKFGDGQYLSDIAPGSRTCSQLSRCFLGMPFQGARFTHYVEIDVTGLNVMKGRDNVFVILGDTRWT